MKLSVTFYTIGLDFRTASLDLRVKAGAVAESLIHRFVAAGEEALAINTCNRVEICVLSSRFAEDLLNEWLQMAGLGKSESSKFQTRQNQEALRHLFRVASSLESMVVGEAQIVGQVKNAYQLAQARGWPGPILHRCFQSAFKVAKKVRSDTEVGQFAVSVPSIGVKLAEKIFGNLSEKTVGVLGLGEIGRIAAEHFGSVIPRKLLLYNRTQEVASSYAEKLGHREVDVVVQDSVEPILKEADVVVSAVSAPLLGEKQLAQMAEQGRRILILDLGVPPSVSDSYAADIYLYRVDDLEEIARENSRLRLQELERAEILIEKEVEQCWKSLETLSLSETFERLSAKVKDLQEKELEALKNRLSNISEEDWREIEKMSRRLSSKILQDPIVELKSRLENTEEKETWLHFFRNIFRI